MKKSRSKHNISATALQTPDSMGALASGMADDFNNILTTVMGACSLIDRDESANAVLLKSVDLIRTSAERAAVLSNELMHAVTGVTEQGDCCSAGCSHAVGRATSKRDKKGAHVVVSSKNKPGGTVT